MDLIDDISTPAHLLRFHVPHSTITMEGVRIRARDQGNFENLWNLKIAAAQSQSHRVGAIPRDGPSQEDDTAVANRRYMPPLTSSGGVFLCSNVSLESLY
ncbi:MAG: hypothetical protein GFH23_1086630n82 [Chloroflexi bacterium AL-N1]|nr:hypothetical protein [Chloroflexi bacterium AL-N1]